MSEVRDRGQSRLIAFLNSNHSKQLRTIAGDHLELTTLVQSALVTDISKTGITLRVTAHSGALKDSPVKRSLTLKVIEVKFDEPPKSHQNTTDVRLTLSRMSTAAEHNLRQRANSMDGDKKIIEATKHDKYGALVIVNPLIWVGILSGMGLLFWFAFMEVSPDEIVVQVISKEDGSAMQTLYYNNYYLLHTIAWSMFRTRLVMQLGFWVAMMLHAGEALYALVLCQKRGVAKDSYRVQWFLQTLMLGYPSLRLLKQATASGHWNDYRKV